MVLDVISGLISSMSGVCSLTNIANVSKLLISFMEKVKFGSLFKTVVMPARIIADVSAITTFMLSLSFI